MSAKTVTMSANQHASLFFAKAIEMATNSSSKTVSLDDVFAALPKPTQKKFVRNGITVEYPLGWKNVHVYKEFVESTLRRPMSANHRQQYQQQLALLNAALA